VDTWIGLLSRRYFAYPVEEEKVEQERQTAGRNTDRGHYGSGYVTGKAIDATTGVDAKLIAHGAAAAAACAFDDIVVVGWCHQVQIDRYPSGQRQNNAIENDIDQKNEWER
jgi:hypothetical protein